MLRHQRSAQNKQVGLTVLAVAAAELRNYLVLAGDTDDETDRIQDVVRELERDHLCR